MYRANTPYFSFKGMAFKDTNTDQEMSVNIRIALGIIRDFAMHGNDAHEAMAAIQYIERQCPKVQTITNDMRLNFFDDDKFPDVDAGRLRRMKLQLCSDLDKRTQQNRPAHSND